MPTICDGVDAIEATIRAAGWRLIGIEGVDGVGKSHLASQLASQLAWASVDVDDYLWKNQGGYAAFVDYEALQSRLSSNQETLIAGVCLREVLGRANRSVDAYIYIKRMRHGLWADETECVFPDGLPAALARHRSDTELVSRFLAAQSGDEASGTADGSSLTEEIMWYHDRYLPHEIAEIVYERVDHAV